MFSCKRSAFISENSNLERKLHSFLSNYFGASYDEKASNKGVIAENRFVYFKDNNLGGWSSYYCIQTWNDSTLENEADLDIFDLFLKIDIKNGADTSKIVHSLCKEGAFEAVKVRKT